VSTPLIFAFLTYCITYNIINISYSGKETGDMGTEAERQDTRKAMAYDLIQILEEKPEKEMKKIIRIYLATADQK
jgi:hypothetical protein